MTQIEDGGTLTSVKRCRAVLKMATLVLLGAGLGLGAGVWIEAGNYPVRTHAPAVVHFITPSVPRVRVIENRN